MRLLRSLLVLLTTACLTLLAAWVIVQWSDAGAPSLSDFSRQHPALSAAFGIVSTMLMLATALLQRRKRKSG